MIRGRTLLQLVNAPGTRKLVHFLGFYVLGVKISQFYVALIITELSVPTMAILKCYYMDNHLSTSIMLSQISIGIVFLKS